MNPLVIGFLGTTGSVLAYELWHAHVRKTSSPPPPGTALDPGMDSATAAVVRHALESETDKGVLDHLATVLLAAGFTKSAAAVSDRSKHVASVVKATGATATSGLWTNVAKLVGMSTDPIDAKELQGDLNALGYGPLAVDGVVGPKTKAALHAFQTSAGVPLADHANEETVSALNYAMAQHAPPMTFDFR